MSETPLTIAVDLSQAFEAAEKRLTTLQEEYAKDLSQRVSGEVAKVLGEFVNYERGELRSVVEQLCNLTRSTEKGLAAVRKTLDAKLKAMQEENAKELDTMRQTVDEKLKRLELVFKRRGAINGRRAVSRGRHVFRRGFALNMHDRNFAQ